MAHILRLASEDYTDTGSRVDLRSGYLRLKRGGYEPKVATAPFDRVVDTIDLIGDSDLADYRSAADDIERKLELARLYESNLVQEAAVVLEWQTDGEPYDSTYASKRALIYDGQLLLTMPKNMDGGFVDQGMFARLALIRHPFWENVIFTEIASGVDAISTWGGTWNLVSAVTDPGTAPARIWRAQFLTLDTQTVDLWCGIRKANMGITDFDPIWELEDGTAGTDTTSQTISGASGGDVMQCTFATTTTLAKRVSLRMNQAHTVTNWDHFAGRYLVLGRFKLSAGSTEVGIQLKYGYQYSPSAFLDEVYFDGTDWTLVELGEVQIPPGMYRTFGGTGADIRLFEFDIYAERLSGSGYLYLDALCLIPAEHLLSLKNLSDGWTPSIYAYVQINDEPHVEILNGSSLAAISPEVTMQDWHMPVDPGVLVLAAQPSNGHVLTELATLNFYYYPRWRLLRNTS